MSDPSIINQCSDFPGLDEKPLAFPRSGGAYDSGSILIYTEVQGDRTYMSRLDRFVSDLAKTLVGSTKQANIQVKVKRLDLEKALLCLVHTCAHVAAIPDEPNTLLV